jgi:hypothetical protein
MMPPNSSEASVKLKMDRLVRQAVEKVEGLDDNSKLETVLGVACALSQATRYVVVSHSDVIGLVGGMHRYVGLPALPQA